MLNFEEIDSDELMVEYLRSYSLRHENEKKDVRLSHYTSVECALNILNSGFWWLGDYKDMNDSFEKEVLDRNNSSKTFYFSSFSRADESLAMYKMYCDEMEEKAVIVQFPYSVLESVISYAYQDELAGGLDDDGRFSQSIRMGHIVRDRKITEDLVETSFFVTEVAYLNPRTGELSSEGQKNNRIVAPLRSDVLIGSVKYNCWDYEQEIRLGGHTSTSLKSNEIIALKLPPDFCKSISIVLGPRFDKNKYKNELIDIRMFGVMYNNSVYSGLY